MTAPTTNRLNIRQKVLKRLYSSRYPLVATLTAASTTTDLVNTAFAPAGQSDDFVRSWVRVSAVGAGDPAVGEVARVTNVDFSGSNSKLIVAPAFSAAPDSGSAQVEIHPIFHPTVVEDKINWFLEILKRPIYILLSDITNGSMESTPLANYTPATGSEALDTTATYNLWTRNAYKFTGSGADDYAESGNYAVEPNEELLIATWVKGVPTTTFGLDLRDFTNATTVKSATTANLDWTMLMFSASAPSTCRQMRTRFTIATDTDVAYYSGLVVLPVNKKMFDYPSTLEYHEDFSGVYELRPGPSVSGTNESHSYAVGEEQLVPVGGVSFIRDDTSLHQYRIQLPKDYRIRYPLLVKGRVDFATLSDDTTTTTAPEDIVVDLVYASLLDDLAQMYETDGDNKRALAAIQRSVQVRKKLLPRMEEFSPHKGKLVGANQ